jgi:hypothetical protein
VLRKRQHVLLGQGSHTIPDVRPGTRDATVVVALESRSWAPARAHAYVTLMT